MADPAFDFFKRLSKTPEPQVLVISQPRTASKYVWGLLKAFVGKGVVVRHCHGISARREEEMRTRSKDPEALAEKLDQLEKARAVLQSPSPFLVTIFRDPLDRYISSFGLSRHAEIQKAALEQSRDELADYLADRFLAGVSIHVSSENKWLTHELRNGTRSGPPPYLIDGAFLMKKPHATHLYLSLDKLDETLEWSLFSVVPQHIIEERSKRMRIKYGIANANRSEDRGYSGTKGLLLEGLARRGVDLKTLMADSRIKQILEVKPDASR